MGNAIVVPDDAIDRERAVSILTAVGAVTLGYVLLVKRKSTSHHWKVNGINPQFFPALSGMWMPFVRGILNGSLVKDASRDIYNKVKYGSGPKMGEASPNPILHRLDGASLKLLDVAQAGRMLILNFGSCS